MRKLLLFCLSFASFAILANILGGQSASAIISNQFIDPVNAGGNTQVKVLVESTDAVSVPNMSLKWFLPVGQTGNRTLVLEGFCAAGQSAAYVEFSMYNGSTWTLQAFPVGVIGVGNYSQLPWIGNGCAGNDLVVGNIPEGWWVPQTVGPTNLYPGYKALLVQVHLGNQSPFAGNINQFRVIGDTGLISQAEIGTAASQSNSQPGQADAFAILGNKSNSYGYNVTFNFAPSCDAPTGTYYMHWRDMDYNQSYGNGTTWLLTDLTNGVSQPGPAAGSPGMGGTNQWASQAVTLTAGHNYAWQWQNVNHLNTIHIWMPFSELQPRLSCTVITTDDAQCVGFTVNTPSITPGSAFSVTITMRNSGTATWVYPTYQLGTSPSQTSNFLGYEDRAYVNPGNIPPGGVASYTFTRTAPGAPGTYPYYWKMVHELVTWFGPQCGGNIVVGNAVTIQGRVMSAANISVGYAGISIETCTGQVVTTGANGWYSFSVAQNAGFCARPITSPPGATSYGDRPWGEGYLTCPAYSGVTATPNYCSTQNYEWQLAGIQGNQPSLPLLYGIPANIDRALDTGYDFAFVFPAVTPVVTCVGNVTFSETEAAVPGTLSTTINNGGAGGPAITITSATYSATPAGMSTSGGVNIWYNPLPNTWDDKIEQTASFAGSNTYTVTMTFNYTATLSSGAPFNGSKACTGTVITYAKPYLKTYGSDVQAGGSFNPDDDPTDPLATCPGAASGTGGIYTFATGSGSSYRGSSAQFGVTALLNVNQFYSVSQRTAASVPANVPPRGTTFANTSGAGDGTYGGGFGGSGTCIPNYFSTTRDGALSGGAFPAALAANLGRKQYTKANNSTLSPAAQPLVVPLGTQAAIYIDGNVFIESNVTFQAGAATRAQMPNLALVVSGNIYIGPNVTRLDGLYIAQPSDLANTGKIYTCSISVGVLPTGGTIHPLCSNQLAVNGAFIAQQVKFYRTGKSLKDSTVGERPTSFNNAGPGSNAAEVISFTPEMYLAPTALKDPSDTFAGRYDAVFSLPPVY